VNDRGLQDLHSETSEKPSLHQDRAGSVSTVKPTAMSRGCTCAGAARSCTPGCRRRQVAPACARPAARSSITCSLERNLKISMPNCPSGSFEHMRGVLVGLGGNRGVTVHKIAVVTSRRLAVIRAKAVHRIEIEYKASQLSDPGTEFDKLFLSANFRCNVAHQGNSWTVRRSRECREKPTESGHRAKENRQLVIRFAEHHSWDCAWL